VSVTSGGPIWAMIAGGGTGGHVVPAVAIAQALVERGHPPGSIHFIGSRRGLEATMVPTAGFSATLLPGRGLARRLTIDNVGAVAGLVAAAARATALVGRTRPAVMITVGGYASVAGALAAVAWRVPLIVAEQNAVPGLANRMVGRFAAACAVSFPDTPLPRAVVTGNPVRSQIVDIDRSPAGRLAARQALDLPEQSFVVAVAGGSLGARRLNDAVIDLVARWAHRSDVAIRHVVGRRQYENVPAARPAAVPAGLVYQQVRFEDRMDLLLAAADLAVQRAGASTVAELTTAGLPAILIPLPGAPGDHQTANADRLAAAGAAVVIADADLDATRLGQEIDRLIHDDAARVAMGAAALGLARPGAARAVAALAEEHSRD
jgi:UDP-N-acetylglucosamine--N-acetylmuramyl-(pentapeptide) pyrophosphoryl-undecaprenol N-acetylglucosamine transferase